MTSRYDSHPSVVEMAISLRTAEPVFECESLSSPGNCFLARAHHIIGPPASRLELQTLPKLLSRNFEEFVEFYSVADGGEFFRDLGTDHSLMWLYPINEWLLHTSELHQAYADMGHTALPSWFTRGIAIGEVSHTLNCFVVDSSGSGGIYLTDHEDRQPDSPIANSLGHLLLNLIFDTVEFARIVNGYPRFTDQVTGHLGLPLRVVSG